MKKTLLACLVLTTAAAAPLLAGSVYVPVASNDVVDGELVETRVWISNPTGQTLTYRVYFIPSDTDGSTEDRGELPVQQIGPRQTVSVSDVVPVGETGMIEISADPELVVGSLLQPMAGDVPLAAARVPLVSSENLIPAGGTAQLQALERTVAGTVSNVGILNLTEDPMTCEARLFRANGGRIGGTAVLSFPRLSHRQFDEVFALLGLPEVRDVRVQINCDQDFYAYATVFGADPEQTLFVQPSISGASELVAPGLGPDIVEFRRNGNFLVATQNDPYRLFELPAEDGVAYSRVEIDFDFHFGGFNTDLFHTVFTLRSDGLFCEMALRGDNLRTFFDTPGQSQRAGGPWRRGGRYHIRVVYDVELDYAALEVLEGNRRVQLLEANANRGELGALDGSLRLDFSQAKVRDDAFFPLWGSTFSNLDVRLIPAQ